MTFEHLFSPVEIGPLTLRNRLVMMPHAVRLAGGYGSAIDRIVDYHVERAKGGVGLIVMSNFLMPASWRRMASWGGSLSTTPLGGLDLANDMQLLPHYRRIIGLIHENGAGFVSQLNASGRQSRSPGVVSFGIPLFAPSPIPCPRTGEIPKEMTIADIEEYIRTMVDGALLMQEAGADGVEMFAAQGYLVHEFLSPSTNRREDRYGGSLENRLRFLLEAIDAIRKAVGRDFVIGVRMNGVDHVPGGLQIGDSIEIARRLKVSGVDYLNVSGMTSLHYPGWIDDISASPGQFVRDAGAIRQAVGDVPICVSSRISSPMEAEEILASGQADLVGMARALISDPELPNKARIGAVEDIRYCTYSNQSCIMGLDRGRGVGCIHNVAVGKERDLGIGKMRPAGTKRKVAVIGGGPAGMAAGRVAAERGHAVHLFERSETLGGQILLAAKAPSKRGLAEIIRWQEHMLRKTSGVTVSTGVDVTGTMLAGLGFGAIVLAAGSVPLKTGYTSLRPQAERLEGIDRTNVLTVHEAFDRSFAPGTRVVILEDDPHLSGAATAEYLASKGADITIVTPHFHAAADLPPPHVPAFYRTLAAVSVSIVPNTFALAIRDGRIECEDRFTKRRFEVSDVDHVVIAMGSRAETSLAADLAKITQNITLVGDCLAPRQIEQAVVEGERCGWMI